ncbi:MAG: pilin [Candidatus Pacebacteria bacterium]|nr:pilin [Candidatus Paceibacterota bacterium]MDD2757287.1 pilin [Candidatus Paceibacterota bacterium]MDD3283575.1 pilin [Candidatus Paceibacterota bacterium]MDD3970049.1 pilin [Candidatus Paceibacterota bacterium]MDD4738089.1 pilin [Candidatus Paceibacterota bacterium]
MKKILSLIFLLLIISTPVFADVQIGEFIITDETTPEEIISYIFQILVGLGALIAVAMVVMAGVEWMTSDGNPGKIDGAKTKIKNALLGVGVLLGSYLIINTINPQIANIQIDDLRCESGIIVGVKLEDDGPELQRCLDSNTVKIEYDIVKTINESKWNFPSGTILKAFVYEGENYTGARRTFKMDVSGNISGDISGAKSIYFLRHYQGVYLYDSVNYNLGSSPYPIYTATSISNLISSNFNNKTQSIEIIQGGMEKYRAVVFANPNHEGFCSLVGESIDNLNSSAKDQWQYSESIGNNRISSLVVKKEVSTPGVTIDRGQVIFYTTKNCGRKQPGAISLPTIGSTEIKECRVNISSTTRHINILDNCSGWDEGDAILSFEILGNAGLVLSTSKQGEAGIGTNCKYFDSSLLEGGTCYADISGTSVYETWGVKPQSFIIISAD